VYPAEIEAVLEAHPRVVEAGVVGVDDERFGRRPVAFVVWQGGEDPEAAGAAAALGRWCRDRLAAFKRPVEIRILERLPRTASGKLIRRQLEERVRQEPPSAPDPGRSWTE
ncbi:MAG TPA: o-succinylbenzoate--CoA ligase, partial [Myxococcota bacterium]|nr:o-succinylbenzoate--CoA ligase [Myxococcota bacterium]